MEDKEIIDTENLDIPVQEVSTAETVKGKDKKKKKIEESSIEPLFNCLRNERIIVRYIAKTSGIWGNNPKHVLSGGMAEGAVRVFVVPKLSSGMFVNVLTDNEKAFLEQIMGLEYNALSIYKKVDNFWDNSNENGINSVRLTKGDNYLNLSDPEDYIRYKILLANKNFIASSLQVLHDTPKATYQFVIISEGEENKSAKDNMNTIMKCYKEFGKVEEDIDILRLIIETMEGKPTSKNSKLEFLQGRVNTLIQENNKLFLKVITDPMLPTKVLIKKAVEAGIISKRGNYLYMRKDNTPLCESGEEPVLNIAAKYLNSSKHQELLFSIQAALK